MRKNHLTLFVLGLLMLFQLRVAAWAQSEQGIAIGAVAGSSGAGIGASIPVIPKTLNFNIGASGLSLNFTAHVDDGGPGSQYDTTARLIGVPITLTYYPFHNWFNLQGGIFFNGNKISFRSTLIEDGHNYGDITGTSHFHIVSPFVGIGFGQPFSGGRLTFVGSLGVLFEGKPGISLQPPNSVSPAMASQIEANQGQLNRDTNWMQFYPVVSLGVVYRF